MAVSTSTLVFALATCVPFGLAIRDTLTDQQTKSNDDPELVERSRADYEATLRSQEAAERAADEARAKAEAAANRTKLRTLYGAEPATLGPALGGIALGTGSAPALSDKISSESYDMQVRVVGEHAVTGLEIESMAGGRERCRELEDDLQQVWGAGEVGTRARYWFNGAIGQRATLKTLPTVCELRIDKFVPAAGWVDRTKTALVPLWLVGRPVKDLRDYLAERPSVSAVDEVADSNELAWNDHGVGPTGRGRTELVAVTANNKVVRIEASAEVEVDTYDAVVTQLTKVYGAPAEDNTLIWKRAKPRLELEMAAGKVYLTAGKPSE